MQNVNKVYNSNRNTIFCISLYVCLTLSLTGGGALNAPTIKNRSAISPWAMLGSPKLLTLFLSVLDIFQQSRFSNFQFLKKISNVVKNIQRGDPSVNFKFLVFWLEILFFYGLKQHKYAFLGTDFGLYG